MAMSATVAASAADALATADWPLRFGVLESFLGPRAMSAITGSI